MAPVDDTKNVNIPLFQDSEHQSSIVGQVTIDLFVNVLQHALTPDATFYFSEFFLAARGGPKVITKRIECGGKAGVLSQIC